MDISYWNKLNIPVEHTVKQFYGKYLWRVSLHIPGGRLLYTKNFDGDLHAELIYRQQQQKYYNPSGYWGVRKDLTKDIDIDLLERAREVKESLGDSTKFRVEEPFIQFYVSDENTAKQIASNFDSAVVKSISGPKNQNCRDLLLAGKILRKTDFGYQYKVVLRDGRFSIETKQQLLNYIENLKDEIKIGKSSLKMLGQKFNHSWGVYFYVNDLRILTFINLIDPTLISNIHELAVVDQ